jgi:hypothetical protein
VVPHRRTSHSAPQAAGDARSRARPRPTRPARDSDQAHERRLGLNVRMPPSVQAFMRISYQVAVFFTPWRPIPGGDPQSERNQNEAHGY